MSKRVLFYFAILWISVTTPSAFAAQLVFNQVYSDSGKALDICLPSTAQVARSTVLVFIHGGGFSSGDKQDLLNFCSLFADKGFVSISINYRLSGEAPYPAARNDVDTALNWIAQNIRPYSQAIKKIVVVGYSAGGTLALLAKHKLIAARVSAAGPTDLGQLFFQTLFDQTRFDLLLFLRDVNPDLASPLFPPNIDALVSQPLLLLHGQKDVLVPISQSVSLRDQVNLRGGQALLRSVVGIGHEILLPNPEINKIINELTFFVLAIDAQ